MEYNNEAKKDLTDEIKTIRQILNKLENEINEAESNNLFSFTVPLMTLNIIEQNLHLIRSGLREWRNEFIKLSETP